MVATQGPGGMRLYVDGALRSSNATVTSSRNYQGYWRVGYDNLSNWPSAPSSYYFAGSIDEAAVYPAALSAAQVAQHYALGTAG
jgi:hypothetical protein